MLDKYCLFGAGGHGRVVASQIARLGIRNICFGDNNKTLGSFINGIEVKFNSVTSVSGTYLIITLGDNKIREDLQLTAEASNVKIGSFIADNSTYFGFTPGKGSMILAGAVVNCDTYIGKGVIVNTGTIVEHDCKIGDFCHLAPGSVVAGGVTLGDKVMIGANATIINGLYVASEAVVGAGSVVIRDIKEPGIYVGNPAYRIK